MSFAKSWQEKGWNLASEKYIDERFLLTGKIWRFRSFRGNMCDWIQPLNLTSISLRKIRSLDFPVNLHTAYYN